MLPHLDAAYTLALYLTRDRVDAEDVVQESILRAVRHVHTLRSDTDARTWLLTIVRRECSTVFRARQSHAMTDSPDVASIADRGESPDDAANRSVVRDRLRVAVDALPANLREVLILREVQDCSYQEIADIIESPIGTVMSRLSRARARLAETLGDVLDVEELS